MTKIVGPAADVSGGKKIRSVVKKGKVESYEVEEPRILASIHYARMRIPMTAKVSGFVAALEGSNGVLRLGKRPIKLARVLVREASDLRKIATGNLKLRESGDIFTYGGDFGDTVSGTGSINNEFVPIMGGPQSHNLYLYDFLKQAAYGFEAKNHNPLAKGIIDIRTAYIIGRGVKVISDNQELIDEWEHTADLNDMGGILRRLHDGLGWCGEGMIRPALRGDGYLQFCEYDPTVCWEPVTASLALNPEEAGRVLYYHIAYPAPWQIDYGKDATAKASEYIIDDILGDDMEWIRVNRVVGEKRGRADIFCNLGWLKRAKDYLTAKIIQAQGQSTFLLHTKVEGSSDEVDQFINDQENQDMPPPGSHLIDNAAIEREFLEPKGGPAGAGQDSVMNEIKTILAVGAGLSPEMLGVGGSASVRATAVIKSEPAYRIMETRRAEMETYIRRLVRRVLLNGIEQKRIKGVKPEEVKFEVIFPELVAEDSTEKIQNIATLYSMKFIKKARAMEMAAKEVDITSFDAEDEQTQIDADNEELALDTYQYMNQAFLKQNERKAAQQGQPETSAGAAAIKGEGSEE